MTSEPDFDDDFFLDRNHADVHREGEDEHERRFREACREIKDIRRHFDESDVAEFFTKYGDVVNLRSKKTTANLLHTLVDVVTHNEVQPKHIEIIVRRVVENFPDLLTHPNEETYNPIFLAIKASQKGSHDDLVDYMITTCASKTEDTPHGRSLNYALSMKMKDGKTCLHLAIAKQLSPKTIKALIEYASDEALAVQDEDGKTPMHHATLFKSCTDTGIELIKLFLERDIRIRQSKLRSPKTFLDASDNSGASVYWQLQTNKTSVTNAYNDWLAKKTSSADTSKKNQQPIHRERAKASLIGDNTPQMGSRLSRSSALIEPVDRNGQDYEVSILDIREKERGMKRDDRFTQPAMSTIAAEIKKRGAENRNTSQDRSNMLNGGYSGMGGFVDDRNIPEITPNISLKRRGTENLETTQSKEKERVASNSAPKKPNSSEFMPVLIKNSNAILLDLKIHYMRTRSTELATSFLHGANMQDIHISFDYDSLPRKLLWHEFLKRFGSSKSGRLTFDNVLQYVTLPRVSVNVTGRLADIEREAEEESGLRQIGALGRKDAKYFLDWLFDKGVRHIISLSVEDGGRSDEKVHSDQVIQESLERLIVEHLDWQKIDLDPETILRVGCKIIQKDGSYTISASDQVSTQPVSQHLRQLSLRWSGSNAVLRSWSEPDGLVLLPQLQKIKLVKPSPAKDYDSPQWISRIVNDFQKRLNSNRKTIRDRLFTASDMESTPLKTTYGSVEVMMVNLDNEEEKISTSDTELPFTTPSIVRDVNPHKWLDTTARFASEMTPFWQKTVKEFLTSKGNPATTEGVETDVIVALIDDGVDMFDTALSDRVVEGKSFDYHDGKVRPPFSSAQGHGTVMASMILSMCPMAKVYPIRLRTHLNANGKRNIDADYAAQAIQAALNKKATIISMSWTLPMPKDKSGSKSQLHAVLQKAVDRKVLMFCSAPDDGKFTELDYPSGPWPDHFFRIGAAAADGTIFKWTPDVGITYVLPGVEVVVNRSLHTRERLTKRVGDVEYETGSSVATALAAGLAAMIIYCIKASILSTKLANQNRDPIVGIAIADNDANMIANPEAMKRAFARLGRVTNANFIQIWEKLDHASDTLEVLNGRELKPEEKLKYLKEFIDFGCDLASSIRA
ncbi:hypothetical protein CFAM422_009587 [Trichoderma lentiforme]|uniref:Peptidase S8/S53 domain-containing protein n=1 Tax=Trichoderma lentiforme TaxID=1567552 RepID=A0A9P4X9U6_9HYPO|nr:hypothetical protein CFAM422_009587 [Trichoderma lentiforme]